MDNYMQTKTIIVTLTIIIGLILAGIGIPTFLLSSISPIPLFESILLSLVGMILIIAGYLLLGSE